MCSYICIENRTYVCSYEVCKHHFLTVAILSIFNPFDCNVPVSTSVEQEKESKQCDFDGDCSNSFIDKMSETGLGKRSDPDGECSQLVFDEALYQLSSPIPDGESLEYCHVNTSSNSNEFSQESDSGDPSKSNYLM